MADKDLKQDEISQLLDSFYEDNTLERKIEDFSKRKEQRKSRVEKNKEVDNTKIVVKDPEQVSKIGDTKPNVMGNQSGGKTRTFDKEEINNESNGTVVIDDNKIKSILKKESGVKLKRKVISKEEAGGDTKVGGVVLEKKIKPETEFIEDKNANRRTIAIIVASILGLMLCGLLVFGITRTIGNFMNKDENSEVQQQYYQEILEWAEKYDSYSDKEKEKITDFEKKYNKLTKEQKESIDEVLKNLTGSTFDELLAVAKSSEKENSKNNNTEIAQKKAELKENINDLKAQLSSAQSDLDDANKELTSAQSAMDKAQQEVDSILAELNQYGDVIDRYNELIAMLETASEEEKAQIQANIDAIEDEVYLAYEAQEKYESAQSALDEAILFFNQVSTDVSNAQAIVDDLSSQISSLQSEYDSLK